jgi:hypothetical protein
VVWYQFDTTERESDWRLGSEIGALLGIWRGRRGSGQRKERLQNCSTEGNAWDSKKSLIMRSGWSMRAETHGGCPTMNAGTRPALQAAEQAQKKTHSNGDRRTNSPGSESAARANCSAVAGRRPRLWPRRIAC